MNKALSSEETEANNVNLIDEIIRLSDFTFERLPMLDIIGERLVDNLSMAFSDLTGTACKASLTSLDYIPMGQIVDGLPKPVVLAVGNGSPFDGEILLVFDGALLLTTIELMLGGRAKKMDQEAAERFTAIELGFGERLASAVLAELQRALLVVGSSSLELDRVETDPENASVAKSASLCARLKISVIVAGHTGVLEVVIPYDTLEPIRPELGKVYFGNRGDDHSIWQKLISGQIERAHMELEVVLADAAIPLQKIMSWTPGDTIDFGIEEGEPATMMCAGEPMFKVSLGKRNSGFAAVKITEEIMKQEKFADDDSNN